jgi:hypothetical protein
MTILEAYCVKCKKKQPMHDSKTEEIKTKNGVRYALKSVCPVCKTKMTRFIADPKKKSP